MRARWNPPAARLMGVVTLAAMMASVAALLDGRFLFFATGLWALAILLLPVARDRDYPLFSMWSFVLLTVGIGVTLRGACLSLGFPDEQRLDALFFLGREPRYFYPAAAWLLLGLMMLTLGWLAVPSRANPPRPMRPHAGRLVALALVLLVFSVVATVLYIQRTGGLESGDWSAKRTVIPDLELAGSGYRSYGGLRFLASLAMFGHLLVLVPLLSPGTPVRHRWWLGTLAVLLLVAACVVPFYASLRTPLAINLVMSAAMFAIHGQRRTRALMLTFTLAVTALGVWAMTVMRPSNPNTGATLPGVFEAAVINRNQIDLPKTAHILAAVPEELPWQYGKTLARWVLAPLPRSLWPDKPVIPPGPEIGRAIYDQRVAGVPPGMVAEWYWNFGWPGIVVGAFTLGGLLRWLHERFFTRVDLARGALFIAGPMTLGFEAVGGSLGGGIFRSALQTAVMFGLLKLASLRVRKR